MLKKVLTVFVVLLCTMVNARLIVAQDETPSNDSIVGRVIQTINNGNADSLSFYFNQRVELSLPGFSAISSRSQAKMMIRDFFVANPPKSFEIISEHKSEDGSYIVGTLLGEYHDFRISFLTKNQTPKQLIYQFSIE